MFMKIVHFHWNIRLKFMKNLPDTLVWRDKLGENEMFLNNYLRHPATGIIQ